MTAPAGSAPSPERPGFLPARSGYLPVFLDCPEEILGGVAFVFMTGMVFVNVICRYLLNSPIPGSDELATLAFTWATFLGASVGVRRQLHLGIEFVTRLFPARVQACCGLLVSCIIAAFSGLLFAYGLKIMATAHLKRTPVLQWSYAWVYLAVPVGAALMILRLAPIALGQFRRVAGRAPADQVRGGVPL
jgi:TRAP-type C4-dicarboxylate transport system permease small subunit